MKKISLLIYLSTLALCANAATSTSGTFISADGKWGTDADWLGGSKLLLPDEVAPSGTGKNTFVTNITFAPTDTTTDTVSMLVGRPSSSKEVTVIPTIDVSKIKTLNLYAYKTGDNQATTFYIENFKRASGDTTSNYTINLYASDGDNLYKNKINIRGNINKGVTVNAYLPFGGLGTKYDAIIDGKLVIDSQITKDTSTKANFAGSHESTVSRFSGSGEVVIKEGNTLSAAGRINYHGGTLNIEENATFKLSGSGSGFHIKNGTIAGNLNLSSAGDFTDATRINADNFTFTINEGGKVIFTSTSTLNVGYATTTGNRPLLRGTMYASAATGALKIAQDLQLSNNAKLVLNSQNAIINGGTGTRLAVSNNNKNSKNATNRDGIATASLVIGEDSENSATKLSVAENTIENIDMYAGSTLMLALNDNKLTIKNIQAFNSRDANGLVVRGDGLTMTLMLCDFVEYGELKFEKLYEAETLEDATKYFTLSDSMKDKNEIVAAFVNGTDNTDGFYVYTQVPEPSTYAAIFGILALSFVLIRRKK